MRTTTARLVVGLAIAAALATSCGDDDDTGAPQRSDRTTSASTAPSTTAAPLATEATYTFGPPERPYTFDETGPDGMSMHSSSTYSGDWNATSNYAWATQAQGEAFGTIALGVLDGDVAGCGSGRFVFFDPSVSTAEHGTWRIPAGFGAGDLAALGGSGTWETTAGDRFEAASGAIRGTIACTGGDEGDSADGPFFGSTAAGTVTVDTRATNDEPRVLWSETLPMPDDPAAPPTTLSDGALAVHLDGTWTGDATARTATATVPDAGAVTAMVLRFTGTVEGCGTGSLVLVALDTVDASDGVSTRTWEIVPGLGTGDLAGASGFGTGTPAADAASSFTGSMACPT